MQLNTNAISSSPQLNHASENHFIMKSRFGEISKIVAEILLCVGLCGAALFFTAPVSLPLLIGVIGSSCFFVGIAIGSKNAAIGCMASLIGVAILVGAYYCGSRLWVPLKDFVYHPKVALIAGSVAATITGIGMALLVKSSHERST